MCDVYKRYKQMVEKMEGRKEEEKKIVPGGFEKVQGLSGVQNVYIGTASLMRNTTGVENVGIGIMKEE